MHPNQMAVGFAKLFGWSEVIHTVRTWLAMLGCFLTRLRVRYNDQPECILELWEEKEQ